MTHTIDEAITLRKEGRYEESRALLTPLLDKPELAARAHLHIAWSFDNQGSEQEAVPHYQGALAGTLAPDERLDALLGLASTLRTLGHYTEALGYFEQTRREFPEAQEIAPFYAMCLYNLGQHKEAVALLLRLLVSTTNDETIRAYRRAIELYADDLDRTW
ncbi:tetratricopeptide repeat protein [Aeromonas schubertii]|uniref:Tetratricopeptide repeat protein n=1 Tax=Aeromonas schubertii TaxID=652 RepID=A0ABS7V7V6_9GAMM|nr:tetratricopeptide repeat protein [Aeromonas schubertii]MBZ6065031.1 tetratricopeptide repeat protein [Aeromonas schubertii]